MPTFLEGVQELHREARVSGATPGTVVDQTGEILRLVEWYKAAVVTIESMHIDWRFMWAQDSFNTVASQSTYTPGTVNELPDDVNDYIFDSIKINDKKKTIIEYPDFKYDLSTGEREPSRVIIQPDNSWILDPTPDAVYSATFDYYMVTSDLTVDADTSLVPARYHNAILGLALMNYAGTDKSAQDLVIKGQGFHIPAMAQLKASQLPRRSQTHGITDGAEITIITDSTNIGTTTPA